MRKTSWMLSLVGIAALGACTVTTHTSGEAQAGGQTPPPATAEPAPAPTPAPTTEPAPAPKKSNATVKGDSVSIPGNIVFDTKKATLKEGAGSEVVLDQLKLFLDENPQVTKLRIEGHTDNVGQPGDNEKLSGERALTIKKWLVDKGVAKERLIAVGFGEKKPVADNSKEEGRAQNRRTEFKIAELKGKAYLGMDPTAGAKVFDM